MSSNQSSSIVPHISPNAHSMLSSIAASPDNVLPPVTAEYLQELLKDKRNLQGFPNVFHHLDRILETEIGRARSTLFHQNGSMTKRQSDDLPEGEGPIVTVQEKVYIPVKENPNYNFIGRLLGPRGLTAKQLESDLDCKIMVRGKGSLRDKKKEDQNRGKPNWEHLSDDLHVLVCVEDHENRADLKVKRAADEIRTFLEQAVKMSTSEDNVKRKQLLELALIKGTYRDIEAEAIAQRRSRCIPFVQLQAARASNAAAALAAAAAAGIPLAAAAAAASGHHHVAQPATSAAAAAALAASLPGSHHQQQQQVAASQFLRLPSAAAAAAAFANPLLLAAAQHQQQQQQQQLLGFPLIPGNAASGGGGSSGDLSSYLLALAAASAPAAASASSSVSTDQAAMMALMYQQQQQQQQQSGAGSSGDPFNGQTGPVKSRQGNAMGLRVHPYSRPGL